MVESMSDEPVDRSAPPGPTQPAALYVSRGVVEVTQRPVPQAEPGRVVVEISHCGICGTDLHLVLEGWGRPGTVGGHESSGTVVEVGEGVLDWAIGDRVVAGPDPSCGTCERCVARQPTQCERRGEMFTRDHDGAFGGRVSLDARTVVRVPDALDLRAAALTEPLAIAMHAITRSHIAIGQSVTVFGAGPIGALIIATLVAAGHGPITVIEPGAHRQALAVRLGASAVRHPDDVETFDISQPDRMAEHATHVVFECSGRRSAMEAGLGLLRRGGTLMLVGTGIDPPRFDPNRILLNEVTVTGSFQYDEGGFEAALDLLASGRLPLDELIDPVDEPLDRLVSAMEEIVAGDRAGKVLVVPRVSGLRPGGIE